MTERRASIGARRNPETEAAVLDAAEALVEEKGISGLSMEAVARRARAGKATLYRWWPTRGALLMAVYQRQKRIAGYPDTGTLEGDVLVCGDDAQARADTIALADAIPGLRGVDAGPLANSRTVEGLTALILHVNRQTKGRATIKLLGI